MLDKIKQLSAEIAGFQAKSLEEVEQFRIKHLSKKGTIAALFDDFKTVPADQKKAKGQELNELKNTALAKINELKELLSNAEEDLSGIDLTMPGDPLKLGTRHPLAISKNPDIVLHTHTSSVQVRDMEAHRPPIRLVTPGRVFRNEAISARAHCIFHQIEALYIDENVSFADLKQTLTYFAKELFGPDTQIRLRPSYFPFTEPSAEMDVSCTLCHGKGCNVCKGTGWLEILGCGMVDPNVLELNGIDKEKYTGFALGMGIERITMLKYGIKDIRLFFENDIRFLEQFSAAGK